MNLANYLHKRPNSQNWQLRWMVPLSARAAIGRKEFTRSLGTPDRQQAVALALPLLSAWEKQVTAAMHTPVPTATNMPSPSPGDIEGLALRIVHDGFAAKLPALMQRSAQAGTLDDLRNKFLARQSEALRNFHAGDKTYWEVQARNALAKRKWLVTDSDFAGMVSLLEHGGLDAFKRAIAEIDGNDTFTASATLRQALERRRARANDGEDLLALFDRYAAQRLAEGRKRKDTLDQDRKIVELFAEFVGEDRSLPSVTESEVRDWRNTVATLPPAFRNRNENKGLSLRDAAKLAKGLNRRAISLTTVNKYLSAVSALYGWACEEGYTSSNPCENLFHDLRKGRNRQRKRRPPFDLDKLKVIFATPLFTGFARDGKEWEAGTCQANDWRFWIPMVCLFTGARIGEIAQLRLDDVRTQSGLPYLLIKEDEDTEQKTKSGANRPAPIHSKLVKIGFLCFVERQRRRCEIDGDDRLFPELSPNKRGQIGYMPSRFWRKYLTHIEVKSGADGYGSHSFRHGITDQLRLAGYLDTEISLILGHTQNSVTANYGIVQQGTIDRLHSMIESVRFDWLDLSILSRD